MPPFALTHPFAPPPPPTKLPVLCASPLPLLSDRAFPYIIPVCLLLLLSLVFGPSNHPSTCPQVRLGTYASDVYMPPSAIVASKAMANDPRAEPKYCERVPYVVVAGPVGARLMDLVRENVTLASG